MLYLSIRDNEEADYVFHPINAFHLMKRLALSMPNLLKKIPNLEFNYELLKKISADYSRSFHGLADIHEYFAFETTEIAAGHLKDLKTGKIFKSNSPLSSEARFFKSPPLAGSPYLTWAIWAWKFFCYLSVQNFVLSTLKPA